MAVKQEYSPSDPPESAIPQSICAVSRAQPSVLGSGDGDHSLMRSKTLDSLPSKDVNSLANPTTRPADSALDKTVSYGDGHGYVCNVQGNEPERRQTEFGDIAKEEAESDDNGFQVGWSEGDPMNPKNMPKGRKWAIVLIVSMGSTCV